MCAPGILSGKAALKGGEVRTVVLVVIALVGAQASGQTFCEVFSENFDTLTPPALPAGWESSRNRNPLQNDFVSAASGAQSSPNVLLSMNATVAQYVTSPLINFADLIPGEIGFALRRSSSHSAGILLEASTDEGSTFSLQIGDTLRPTGETAFEVSSIPLSPLLSDFRGVRFRWRTIPESTGSSGTLRLDDVTITARAANDLAIHKVAFLPQIARESTLVSAHITAANLGTRPASGCEVVLGYDADRDSNLSPQEQWGTTAQLPILAPGETTQVTIEFVSPAAGEYLLTVEARAPQDQVLANNSLKVQLLVSSRWASVVINEIVFAPPSGEPEWVELYNPLDRAVTLNGWKLGDASFREGKGITAESVLIGKGEFVVLTKDTIGLYDVHPDLRGRAIGMTGFPSLNNAGDEIILRDNTDSVIDSVCYSPSWGGMDGASLERRDFEDPACDPLNWSSSLDPLRSTPGRPNSIGVLDVDLAVISASVFGQRVGQSLTVSAMLKNVGRRVIPLVEIRLCVDADGDSVPEPEELVAENNLFLSIVEGESSSVVLTWESPPGGIHRLCVMVLCDGDLRSRNDTVWRAATIGYLPSEVQINELMFAPLAGSAEFVEIVNTGGEGVDLCNWTVGGGWGEGPTSKGYELAAVRTILQPGEYFVLASDSSILRRYSMCAADSGHLTIVGKSSLQLDNDGDQLVLRDATGMPIDSVAFSARWHNPELLDLTGRSLEKVRPALPSADPRSWGSSVSASGGTPGCVNSIFTDQLPNQSRLTISPNPFSPDGDGKEDYTLVQYEVPMVTCTMMITIFDVRGRLIRRLSNNDPCTSRGIVAWDGLNEDRQKVRIGIYVVLLEVCDGTSNILWTDKSTVVVAGRL